MSDQPNSKPTQIDRLHGRLHDVRQLLGSYGKQNQTKRKAIFSFGIVLGILSVIGMVTLTSTAFKLDAQAITNISRLQIEKHLPDGRVSLSNYLKSEAPRLVSQTLRSLIEMLLHLRGMLTQDFDEQMIRITADGEKELMKQMEASIESTKSRLDVQHPDLSEKDK